MPFQPLQDSDPDKPRLADLGLLVIRLLAVATFAYYQLVRQLHLAVDHLWEGADWDLVSQLAERGLPSPDIIASAAVGLQIVTLLGVVFGIFTRINALLFTLMIGFVLFSAISLSASLTPQALYLAIFLGLACGGAGRLSLDHLLAGRRARKRAV
jgi:uncharacterized membrane protein YphA (DoxX/SURF4 family)